eukprot:scaffold6088_cov140-Skeletonema_dohrnii-CCMP3373.AAC.22
MEWSISCLPTRSKKPRAFATAAAGNWRRVVVEGEERPPVKIADNCFTLPPSSSQPSPIPSGGGFYARRLRYLFRCRATFCRATRRAFFKWETTANETVGVMNGSMYIYARHPTPKLLSHLG